MKWVPRCLALAAGLAIVFGARHRATKSDGLLADGGGGHGADEDGFAGGRGDEDLAGLAGEIGFLGFDDLLGDEEVEAEFADGDGFLGVCGVLAARESGTEEGEGEELEFHDGDWIDVVDFVDWD